MSVIARPELCHRLLLTLLLCALAALTGACSGTDQEASSPPRTVVQTTVEPVLADLAARGEAAQPQLVPLGAPSPPPWAPAPVLKSNAPPPPMISAVAAVVIDEASGDILYDKLAHMPAAPASLTKIATLILALEDGRLDDWVETDIDSREMRGSTVMGLVPGDRFTLRDLLYGMMLPSGNDAALAVGRFISGSDEAFVRDMNNLMRRLGLTDTTFTNPHGLDRGGGHLTTAYDLAVLSRYGMSLPGFKEIVTARSWTARGSRTLPLTNINGFLGQYAGADGIKTGYTRRAGSTLAASAARRGVRLYAIILNSPSREADAQRLLDWAFANYTWPQ